MSTTQEANKALLDSIRRLGTGQHLIGDQACIVHAALGIDTLAIGSAPERELVRVYVYTDNPDTFCLLRFAAYLGIAQPFVKSAMEFVTIFEYGHQPPEILALVPSHADCLNTSHHVVSPFVENNIVDQGCAI